MNLPARTEPRELATRVQALSNPFTLDRQVHFCRQQITVLQMLWDIGHPERDLPHTQVWVDDQEIPRHLWATRTIPLGSRVTVRVRPRGAVGRAIATVFVAIAAVVVSILTYGALAPTVGTMMAPIISGVAGATVGLVGNLVVRALFPPPSVAFAPPALSTLTAARLEDKDQTTNYLSGVSNKNPAFETVPRVIGTRRMVPPMVARFYTEVVGDDQYLRVIYCWGYGPLEITDLRIGETPLENYTDYEIEHRQGWPTDEPLKLYTNDVWEESLNVALTYGNGWQVRQTQQDVQEISLDITFQRGLYSLSDQGQKQAATVSFSIRYRKVGETEWIYRPDLVITAASNSAVRRGIRWDVYTDPGQYEVAIRRLSADPSDPKWVTDSTWTALRSINSTYPINFPFPLALTALRIKATDQINGVITDFNGVVSSLLPDWDTATQTWIERVTSNPASAYRHVLQGAPAARPLADSRVDVAMLQEWHEFCQDKGFEINHIFDSRMSMEQVLKTIAACGRATPTVVSGNSKWSVIVDEPQTVPTQHFSPVNTWDFSAQIKYPDLPHAFRCPFINAAGDFKPDERIVYNDPYTEETATKFETLELAGVTDKDQVFRMGRYHLAQGKLRREEYTFYCDIEHLRCLRGDLVRVSSDVTLWGGDSARVKEVLVQEGTGYPIGLVLNMPVKVNPGYLYNVRVRIATGESVVANLLPIGEVEEEETPSGLPKISTLVDGFNDNSLNADLWNTVLNNGTVTEVGRRIEIAQTGNGSAQLVAKNIYDLRDSSIPIKVDQVSDAYFTEMLILDKNGKSFQIYHDGASGNLVAIEGIGWTYSSVPYNATNHKWWRMREASGTLYFETSPDTVTWNTLKSFEGAYDVSEVILKVLTVHNAATTQNFIIDIIGIPAKISTLVDNFNDNIFDTNLWRTILNNGTVLETNQRIAITQTAGGQTELLSKNTYDLRESAVFARIQVSDGLFSEILVMDKNGNPIIFYYDKGANNLVAMNGITWASVTIPYNALDHRWWRIREASGTIYWETSIGNADWTVVMSSSAAFDVSEVIFKAFVFTDAATTKSMIVESIGRPKASTLKVDFNNNIIDPLIWEEVDPTNGICSVANGKLEILPQKAGHTRLRTWDYFDLTNDRIFIKVDRVSDAAWTNFSLRTPVDSPYGDTRYQICFAAAGAWEDHDILLVAEGVTNTIFTTPFDPVMHKWWQFREESGTLYFETSPDGYNWTTIWSFSGAYYVGACRIFMEGNCQVGVGAIPATISAVFDNLNVPPDLEMDQVLFENPIIYPPYPEPGNLILFGLRGMESRELLITGIFPRSDLSARIQAVDYDPAVYTADTEEIPPFNSLISPLPEWATPIISTMISDGTVLAQDTNGNWQSQLLVIFKPISTEAINIAGIEVVWRIKGTQENWQTVFTRSFQAFCAPVQSGSEYEVKARYVKADGRQGPWCNLAYHTVQGKEWKPYDVTGFNVSQSKAVMSFWWDPVPDRDLRGYELRYGVLECTWDEGKVITTVMSGTSFACSTIPVGTWKFMVKAVDTSGNYSENYAYRNYNVQSFYQVLVEAHQWPAWLGTKTNLIRNPRTGNLNPDDQTGASGDNFNVFNQVLQTPYASMSYEAPEIDLGANKAVRVWSQTIKEPVPGYSDGTPTFQIDYKLEGGSYDGFEDWTIGPISARYIKAKLVFTTPLRLLDFVPTVDKEL